MDAKKLLKSMLDKRAESDKLFADAMAKPAKSLDECWKYVLGQARKIAEKGCACVPDDEVMNWAIHYYDEDDINVSDNVSVASKVKALATARKEVGEVDETDEVEKQPVKVVTPVSEKKAKVVDDDFFCGSLFG